MHRLVPLLLLVVTACGGSPTVAVAPTVAPVETVIPVTPTPICAERARVFTRAAEPIIEEWQDALELAGNAPRMSLAPQVEKLQEIRRRVRALESNECARVAQDLLVQSMDHTITAYLDFMAQRADDVVQASFEAATANLSQFTDEMNRLGRSIEAGVDVAAVPTYTPLPTLVPVASFPIEGALEAAGGLRAERDGTPSELVESDTGDKTVGRVFRGKGTVQVTVKVFERLDEVDAAYQEFCSEVIDSTGVGETASLEPIDVGEKSVGKGPRIGDYDSGMFSAAFIRCHAFVQLQGISATGWDVRKSEPFLKRLDEELQVAACR